MSSAVGLRIWSGSTGVTSSSRSPIAPIAHTSSERRNEPTDCGRRSSFAMHERWTSLPSGCALFHLVSFFLSLSWLALSASASLSASANASITACASRSFAASALSLAIMLMLGDASAPAAPAAQALRPKLQQVGLNKQALLTVTGALSRWRRPRPPSTKWRA